MKRILLSAILLLALFIGGFAQNNVMYVYRNDGVINSFLKEEIDSIRWSCLDIDSVAHQDYVCQEVWTADSVYRIPLELVDSVSFVTPKTVLNEGVVDIAKSMWEYVLRSENQTFILNPSIPSGLIPSVGTKLVYMKIDEKFPGGFAGEVSTVNSTAEGYSVECKDVKLEDVFDTFYSVTSLYGYADDENNSARTALKGVEEFGDESFRLPTIRLSQSEEISRNVLSRDLAIKGGTKYELSIYPQFHVRTSLIINKEMGVYHSASIYGDITIQQQLSLYGGLEYEKDFLDPEVALIPVAPFTYFYLKPGLFVDAEVDATLSGTLTHRYTTAMAYDYSSKGENMLNPTCGGRLADSSLEVEGSIDGKIALGGFIEAGVTFAKSDLDKLSARLELGGELVGHAVLYNSEIDALDKETNTYEKFKNSKFELNAFVHSFAEAKIGLWGIKKSLPWDLNYNIRTWDVVPIFSNVSLKKNSEYPIDVDAFAEMSGDCLIPVGVGFSLFDGKKNLWDTYSSDTKFDNGYKYMNHTFSSTQSGNKYIVYPTVDFLGFKMLASPKAEIELEEHGPKVHITNFEQTGATYNPNGYSYEDYLYSFKYDVATTVSIDNDVDISTIEDWGYVYNDPYGKTKRISLLSNSSPYTDTRYAYYRNAGNSTVKLYGYLKYKGDESYYYEESHDYPLVCDYSPSCEILEVERIGYVTYKIKVRVSGIQNVDKEKQLELKLYANDHEEKFLTQAVSGDDTFIFQYELDTLSKYGNYFMANLICSDCNASLASNRSKKIDTTIPHTFSICDVHITKATVSVQNVPSWDSDLSWEYELDKDSGNAWPNNRIIVQNGSFCGDIKLESLEYSTSYNLKITAQYKGKEVYEINMNVSTHGLGCTNIEYTLVSYSPHTYYIKGRIYECKHGNYRVESDSALDRSEISEFYFMTQNLNIGQEDVWNYTPVPLNDDGTFEYTLPLVDTVVPTHDRGFEFTIGAIVDGKLHYCISSFNLW